MESVPSDLYARTLAILHSDPPPAATSSAHLSRATQAASPAMSTSRPPPARHSAGTPSSLRQPARNAVAGPSTRRSPARADEVELKPRIKTSPTPASLAPISAPPAVGAAAEEPDAPVRAGASAPVLKQEQGVVGNGAVDVSSGDEVSVIELMVSDSEGEQEEEEAEQQADEGGERVSVWGRRASEYANGKLPTTDKENEPWLVVEEEDMARFLASGPRDEAKVDGGSIWQQYATMRPRRIFGIYTKRYTERRGQIDAMARSIKKAAKGEEIVYDPSEAPDLGPLARPGHVSQGEKRPRPTTEGPPSSRSPLRCPPSMAQSAAGRPIIRRQSYVAGSSMFGPSGSGNKTCYGNDVVGKCDNCTNSLTGYSYVVAGQEICGSCYSAHSKAEQKRPGSGHHILGQRRERILGGATGADLMGWPYDPVPDDALVFYPESEDEAPASSSEVLSQPARPTTRSLEQRPQPSSSSKRPRLSVDQSMAASQRSQPVASGSGTSHHHRHSLPSSSARQPPRPAPAMPAPRPAPAARPIPPQREPEPFLDVGVPPAHHPRHLDFCFFCGDNSPASAPYADLVLATANEQGAVDRVAGQTACSKCRSWFRVELGLARLAGEGEELERMGKVTRRLVERGVEIRRGKVEG